MNDQNILAGMAGRGLRISMSDICDVLFFAIPLTVNQIQDIEKQTGVRFVRPNQDLYMEGTLGGSDLDSDPADMPVLTAPGNPLQERDRIVTDRSAWEDLRFISTPRNSELSSDYFYYSNAGRDVTIFAVDRGANILHDEFVTMTGQRSLLEDIIYAMDTSGLPDDEDNLGTCCTSKIVGQKYGVAKRAKVMIAKVSPTLGSVIDVLVQIANYLNQKSFRQENVKGYHVMSIMIQWDNSDPQTTEVLEEILNILVTYYQLVVVVPAGMDLTGKNSDINMWPATAERRHEIIGVGAVEVRRSKLFSFSRGGPFLSVNAPGLVKCARNQAGSSSIIRHGTDVAAAQVAGLVAYLLSLDDIGPQLRQIENQIASRVKSFVKLIACKRMDDGFPAIWNLVGAMN